HVLPGVEGRAEERLHRAGPRARLARGDLAVDLFPLGLDDLQVGVLELAALGGAQADLHLLVEDQFIVLLDAAVHGELGPAVLERDVAAEVVADEAGAELRLKRVGEQLGVAVEHAVGRVPAILVHGGDHDELERIHPWHSLATGNGKGKLLSTGERGALTPGGAACAWRGLSLKGLTPPARRSANCLFAVLFTPPPRRPRARRPAPGSTPRCGPRPRRGRAAAAAGSGRSSRRGGPPSASAPGGPPPRPRPRPPAPRRCRRRGSSRSCRARGAARRCRR